MVQYGFTNEYKKDTCVIKLRVQTMIVILGLVVNISVLGGDGETYMTI